MTAVMFLTRLPLPKAWSYSEVDIGHSSAFFPLVGAGVGLIQAGLLLGLLRLFHSLNSWLNSSRPVPFFVLAVFVVVVGALVTGALHLDGLADMADGFGAGRSREDVLRIMRDHAIGAYGSVALIVVLALKMASIAALIERGTVVSYLIGAPALARASIVVLGYALPYARVAGGFGDSLKYIGPLEVLVSTASAVAITIYFLGRQGGIAITLITAASLLMAWLCRRRIGGMTGDTLGANVEICESLILALGTFLA